MNARIKKREYFAALNAVLLNTIVWSLALAVVGCNPSGTIEADVRKKPRPIETMTLARSDPPSTATVSASVASWKTEEIGFEVSGRVEWVIEPGQDVEGRILGKDGEVIIEGTPIARIENERYRLQKESAQADLSRAEQGVASIDIEIGRSLPSQVRAAEAELKLARTELERSKLAERNAGAQADVDRDQANFENAESRIEQLEATSKAKEAERTSLLLQVEKARQALKDAQRNLDDCVMYSSFRGQIADVAVVPGSVVSPGQPVVTVQMMDPIKVEVEVSAADSRRLRKRQRIPVMVPLADGTEERKDGFLYLIDPTADPQTRTYTLTLLMLNERNVGQSGDSEQVAVTDQTWRLDFQFLPGSEEGRLYAPEEAIRRDADGPFLWRVRNMKSDQNLPEGNIIQVAKMRIELGESQLPFLGNWVFQEVILGNSDFDPSVNLIAGKISTGDEEPDEWDGDQLKVDRSAQWKIRPGDVVRVDLSNGNSDPGIFVPMDVIAYENEKTFVYFVEPSGDGHKVRKQEVRVDKGGLLSETIRLFPIGDEELAGKQISTLGVHYLRDGEEVRVSDSKDSSQ